MKKTTNFILKVNQFRVNANTKQTHFHQFNLFHQIRYIHVYKYTYLVKCEQKVQSQCHVSSQTDVEMIDQTCNKWFAIEILLEKLKPLLSCLAFGK